MNESLIHFFFFLSVNIYIMTFFPMSTLFKESEIIFPSKNNILILTPSTLDEALKKYKNLVIMMYAPWCPHCEELLPELEKAAKSKRINDMNLTFAKIDVYHYTLISKKYNIDGFPTVIFFVNGEQKEIFNGGRDKESIIEWLYKRLINPVHKIETIDDINEYQNEGKFNFIYFGQNKNNIQIYQNFSLTQKFKFGLCQDLEIINKYKIIEPETAVYYKPFDEPSYVITKNITIENLEKIIEDNIYPLIYNGTKELLLFSVNYFQPAFFFFRNITDLKEKEYYESLKKIALKYKGKIKFSIGDYNDNFVQEILNKSKIYIYEECSPTALIFDYDGHFNNWKYDDFFSNYNETNLELFIKNWVDKKLDTLKLKTEEDPGKQEEGKVYKVVYQTFKRDVLYNKLNVFVKFYKPNDTLSKEIEPIYKDLAMKLKINRNIRIAEYNLEENYFDYIKIEHYPTLMLFRAGYKDKDELIEYKGNMIVNDILYFVLTNQEFPILNKKKKKKFEEKKDEKINGDL